MLCRVSGLNTSTATLEVITNALHQLHVTAVVCTAKDSNGTEASRLTYVRVDDKLLIADESTLQPNSTATVQSQRHPYHCCSGRGELLYLSVLLQQRQSLCGFRHRSRAVHDHEPGSDSVRENIPQNPIRVADFAVPQPMRAAEACEAWQYVAESGMFWSEEHQLYRVEVDGRDYFYDPISQLWNHPGSTDWQAEPPPGPR